ncbi:MAG TPA: peptidyl-prolyl cis-trans isomerase [Sphingomicrobium sp.]|nr:peptidyl-prolyl cis-trans isomerase [Sphingomicrobium sp.]
MLSFFRRVANSKIGTWVVAAIGLAILGGFALADLSNFGTGNLGFGVGPGTLAKVGDQAVDEREMTDAMQRRLQTARQQQPTADYATIIADFYPVLEALIDDKALIAFSDANGFPLSKRLIDAEIATIPATKGYNGQFSEQAYQAFLAQQRMSDAQVREILAGGMLQRLLLTPVVTNPRIPLGMATPYTSMLLEQRDGEGAIVPADAFKGGLNPTDAQLQQFYAANKSVRYMVPEQRVLRIAKIGPDQVSGVAASDQEIAAYYNQHKDDYAPKDTRSLSQVVVPDQASAAAIAQRAKAGATLAAAAAPAGPNAAVSSLNDQTRTAYSGVAGDKAADAVFAAKTGDVVGPLQSQFGWLVVKVDSIKKGSGKTLDEARAEIAQKLNADKRKGALEDLVDKVQNALDQGSNFEEAVSSAKLQASNTPLVTASGVSRADPSFKMTPDLAPILKAGFEIAPNDPPEVVTLPGNAGYAVVSPGQVVPAAPAPLASIKDQVTSDWINQQALQRAGAAAQQIAGKASSGMSLAEAIKAIGATIPPPRPISARRIQMTDQQGHTSAALKILFDTGIGKARMAANPQGGGFFVVKVDKITPGNAISQPGLISQVTRQLNEAAAQDYAQQFLADMKREMKVKRNESAIQAFRARLLSNGG